MAKVMKTMDGNTAAAHVAYAFTDVAAIYPITPSSTMAELIDAWSANERRNIFGQKVLVKELQSEAGAAGAVHGSLSAGALTSTFTASQGLLLMIPNMYKIAGEFLPAVFHVTARSIAGHALSIFGDHQDVMAARQTGFALLASGSVQEVMDLAAVAHLSAIKGSVPFVHFFDGFRTSHEIQKVEVMDTDQLKDLVDYDALNRYRQKALNPHNPYTKGTAQNPDIYFQALEAGNPYYDKIVDVVVDYMDEISKVTGRDYKPFNYYGHPEAERIVIAMGSVTETLEETVDYLIEKGEKVGIVKVHLYRPFSAEHFFNILPKTVKKISVLDRTKEKGAVAEPLHLDVQTLFYNHDLKPVIVGGRYGLSSKDVTPTEMLAVFENLKLEKPKDRFTVGIVDDVTNLSLEIKESIKTEPEETIRCKFWGFGSDGTVGANKQAIKIIGDDTDMYAQGYFAYDSKKSGGVTISHLRFGKEPIRSTYLITDADFVSCARQAYVNQYHMLDGLKDGGTFLLNTIWSEEELNEKLPASMKKYMADHNINFYIINATKLAAEIGLGGRTNMIMQSAFFKLSGVLPMEDALSHLRTSIEKEYGRKGDAIVQMNYKALDAGIDSAVKVEIPADWANAKDDKEVISTKEKPEFITNVLEPMVAQEGDKLPVSTFVGREDGSWPNGTAAYEKRAIAVNAPHWIEENCIQCNQCSFVCPHAVIRPFLLDEEEVANAPEGFVTKKANGADGFQYRIQISPADCTGCGNCADICPAKNKALEMRPLEHEMEEQQSNWDFAMTVKNKPDVVDKFNVRGSQFQQPLLEFSGACAGCGETAYVKLITQLFGDRMMISNATGCSSIWGGSAPSTPYCANQEGFGPSWANSLFEDAAEHGYGMAIAVDQMRNKLQQTMEEFIALDVDAEINKLFQHWLDNKANGEETKIAYLNILGILDKKLADPKAQELLTEINNKKDFIIKRSMWIIGGDGWAYDIGFGGVDHVLASAMDINILVLDTEVYSNTGGQSSKATPTAAVAKFAANGKRVTKKNLGLMMTSYGYVYVAQVALGADKNQLVKAIQEAESYDGPSVVIAYAPCINHGIKGGMGKSVEREKLAVETGYWHLYRFDPRRKAEGLNPFVLDSKEPSKPFTDFIDTEVRYTSLKKEFPEIADELFEQAAKDAEDRYKTFVDLAK